MIPKHLGPPVGQQTYFVTSNTHQRIKIFQVERWARVFLKNLYQHRRDERYLLHSFVLMPDHFHLLVTPLGGTLERVLQLIKGGSARALKLAGRNSAFPVWQKGYTDRRVRSPAEYREMLEYIEQNPVRARLVEKPEDYRYGSAYPGYRLDPPRPYLSG